MGHSRLPVNSLDENNVLTVPCSFQRRLNLLDCRVTDKLSCEQDNNFFQLEEGISFKYHGGKMEIRFLFGDRFLHWCEASSRKWSCACTYKFFPSFLFLSSFQYFLTIFPKFILLLADCHWLPRQQPLVAARLGCPMWASSHLSLAKAGY